MSFLTKTDEPRAKREILKAALTLFTRDGLDGTSIRKIATESGFTNPALYKHFDSKRNLAEALFERCYGWMVDELDHAMSAAHEGERLEAFLRRYLGMLDEHLEAVVYVNENLHHFWPRMPASLRERTIVTMVREIVDSRLVADGNPENWVVAIVGLVAQTARMTYLGGLEGPALDRFDDVHQICSRMLG
jgi:AcrR family transcriptional regulator